MTTTTQLRGHPELNSFQGKRLEHDSQSVPHRPRILRHPYNDASIRQAEANFFDQESPSIISSIVSTVKSNYGCHGTFWETITDVFPILKLIGCSYTVLDVLSDIITGLTVTMILVPQSLAYAPLAGLPSQYGLYTAFISSIVYLFLGPTRQTSAGPFALVSLILYSSINSSYPELAHIEQTDPATGLHLRLVYTMTLTLLSSFWLFFMALFRLGWVINLVSAPAMSGFIVGASFTIASTQIGTMFGVKTSQENAVVTFISLMKNIGATNVIGLIIGIICTIIIIACDVYGSRKNLKIPIPSQILLVIIGTALCALFSLDDRFKLSVLGEITMGYPKPVLPQLSLISVDLLTNSFACALVTFVIGASITQSMCELDQVQPRYNQELLSLGVISLLGSFSNAYAGSAALSRSIVVHACKPRSQLWNLTTICTLGLVIWFIAPLLYHLPKLILSAVLIASLRTQYVKIFDIPNLFRQSPAECIVHTFTLIITLCVNTQTGVLIAFVSSMLQIVLEQTNLPVVFLRNIHRTQRWVHYTSIPLNNYYQYIEHARNHGWSVPNTFQSNLVTAQHDDIPSFMNQNHNQSSSSIDDFDLSAPSQPSDHPNTQQYTPFTDSVELSIIPTDETMTAAASASISSSPTRLQSSQGFDDDPRIVALHVGGPINFLNHNPLCEFLESFIFVHGQWLNNNRSCLPTMVTDEQYSPEMLRQDNTSFISLDSYESGDDSFNYNSSMENGNSYESSLVRYKTQPPQQQPQPSNEQQQSSIMTIPACGDPFVSFEEQTLQAEMIKGVLENCSDEVISKWTMCIVFDNVISVDLSARRSLTQLFKRFPHVLFLFSRSGFGLLQLSRRWAVPMSYYIDNLYVAMNFGQKLINVAQSCRFWQLSHIEEDSPTANQPTLPSSLPSSAVNDMEKAPQQQFEASFEDKQHIASQDIDEKASV